MTPPMWAFFLVLACASAYKNGKLEKLQGKRQMVYRYEVQLSTGAEASSQLWSVLKLTADLSLKINNQHVVAQMNNVSIQKMDKFISEETPNFFVQGQNQVLDGIEVNIREKMAQPLQKPFSFTWKDGHVQSVTFEQQQPLYVKPQPLYGKPVQEDFQTEALFSLNIKKGILNLLNVNMDKLFSLQEDKDKSYNVNGQQQSYTVVDPSPFGPCLTTYTPELVPESREPGNVYLVKVRNYSSCYSTPPMAYSFDNLNSENNQSTDHLNLQAEVKYGIRGNKESFVIDSAIGQSKIIFVPYARMDGSVQTSVNQTLYLLSESAMYQSLPTIQGQLQQSPEALTMTLPVENVQDRRPYILWEINPQPQSPWTSQKMNQLLNLVANGTSQYPSQQLLTLTQTLMEMIRQSTKVKLKELLFLASSDVGLWDPANGQPLRPAVDQEQQQQHQQRDQEIKPLKIKVLWNLLSYAGTTQTSEAALEECLHLQNQQQQQRFVPSYNACITAVTAIGLYTPPSESVILSLIELIHRNQVTENEKVQAANMQQQSSRKAQRQKIIDKETLAQVGTLALGSLLGRGELMVEDIEKSVQRRLREVEQVEEQFTDQASNSRMMKYKQSLMSKRDSISIAHLQIYQKVAKNVLTKLETEDKILLLKTLRNAHTRMSLPKIEKFLLPKEESPTVRVAAAQALETFTQPRKHILKVLEKIVKDPRDTMAVRVQAFRSMVNLRTPVHMLVRLADSIKYEKEKQLSTYVWSVFNHLANSTFRPYRRSASMFRAAMCHMLPVQYGVEDSQYRSMQADLANEVTVLKESSYVAGPDFSHNLDISSTLDMFGTTNKAFQLTMVSEGLLGVAQNLFGEKGFLTNRNPLLDLLQRPKRDTSKIQQMIEQIFQQLHIKERVIPDTGAYVDLQVMNQVVRIYKLSTFLNNLEKNEPFIVMDMNEDRLRAGVSLHMETSGIVNQYFMELPSEAGFPVNMQMGFSYTAKLNGTASALVHSSIYKDNREGMPPTKVEMELDAQPKIVGALTGKMSVDGFLLQTGNLFEAMISLQSGGRFKLNMDLYKNRITASFAPSVSSEVPVVKMEMKPYVYSLAVSTDMHRQSAHSPEQAINNRPVFITLQPVAITQGAQLKQMQYKLGRKDIGYMLTMQGQYPSKALTSATTSPLLGRSHYAMYVESGMENPPPLVADIRYFSHRRYQQEACDTWFPWQCYSTDLDSPAPRLPEPKNASFEFGKVHDIPDLDSDITLHALKENIMATVGQKMPQKTSKTEWGLIAIFNGTSSTVVKGLGQTWHKGQYHQSIITVHSLPLYQPHAQPFKMAIKNAAIYPGQKFNVRDLLDVDYQVKTHRKMYRMMQRAEHKVVNRYFQPLLLTLVNNNNVRHLPSMDPQIMLDRILPESVLVSKAPHVIHARHILQTLLPVSHQMRELHSQMDDALTIQLKQELLRELQKEIVVQQAKIIALIEKIGKQQKTPRSDIAAAEYTVLKVTQAVLHITEVVERGLKLSLLRDPHQFQKRQRQMQRSQDTINKMALANFGSKENAQLPEENQHLDENDFENTIGYDQLESSASKENDQPIPPQEIIPNLKALTEHQLKQIRDLYESMMSQSNPRRQPIMDLVERTADNITMLNNALRQASVTQNRTMTVLITQVTTQHQILVHMLRMSRINSDDPNTINNIDRYSVKVQTKELLERGYILLHQTKAGEVCAPHLNLTEQRQMKQLEQVDRQLVALQRDRIILPNNQDPWTSSSDNLRMALATMQPVLRQLRNVRDQIVACGPRSRIPHPCLVAKLVDSATTLQQRVSLFKQTLLAQPQDQMEQRRQYQKLDDQTMQFVLSLTPLFDLYVTVNASNQTPIFPRGEILISQSLMEEMRISWQQSEVLHKLNLYLDQPFPLPYDEVKKVLKDTADNSEALLHELKDASRRLTSSLRTTTPLTARAMFQHFIIIMNTQLHIYDQIQEYMQKYPSLRSELNIEVDTDKSDTEKLKNQMQKLSEPARMPKAAVNSDANSKPFSDEEDSLDQLSQGSDELRAISGEQQNPYMEYIDQMADLDMDSQQVHSGVQDDVAEVQSPQVSEQILKKRPMDLEPLFEGIIMNSNITYGHNNYLGIQVYAQKSVPQLLWETSQFYPRDRDFSVSRTVEDAITGREGIDTACLGTCLRLNAYNHVHMHVSADSDQLPAVVKQGMQALMLRNLARHNSRTDMLPPQPFVQPGTMQAILDIANLADSVDEYLLTANRTMAVQSIPTDPYLTLINPFQNAAPISTLMQKHFSNGLMPAECRVQKGNLKTTDGAVFTVPRVQKPVLLAADCSKDKAFAVLMQEAPVPRVDQPVGLQSLDPRNRQSLKIWAEKYEVVLKPHQLSVEVLVNNQSIPLRPGQPFVRYAKLKSGTNQVALVIGMEEKGIIHVEYPLVGLNLHFGINGFTLQTSNIYSKQLCGLCGNFDGQITWELEGPREQIFSAADDFTSSYRLGQRPRRPQHYNSQYIPQ